MLGMINAQFVVSIIYYDLNKIQRMFQGIFSAPENISAEDHGCSISSRNKTLIYETPNPYSNDYRCKAEFNCPDDQIIRYSIERFDIEQQSTCNYDSLGMYNL